MIDAAAAAAAAADGGGDGDGMPAGGGTHLSRAVAGYLAHLTVERALALNTLSSYRRDLVRYVQVLAADGVTDPEAVTPAHVTGYLGRLREGDVDHPPLSASSTARAVSAVRGFHRFALRDGRRPGTRRPASNRRGPHAGCRRRCRSLT